VGTCPLGGSGAGLVLEAEELSGLIADIYDASLDRDRWEAVLKRTCEFVRGGVSAVLFSQDFAAQSGRFHFHWGDNPEYTQAFFSTYMKISPLTPHLMMTRVGETFAASRLMPYEELVASRFFQEWCVPQGYNDFVATNLDKTTTSMATVSLGRGNTRDLISDEDIRRMRLLAPHFRRAVLISRVIELHKLEADMLNAAFDGIAAMFFLVDAQAAIVHANRHGRAALDEGDVVTGTRALLTLSDLEANRTLHDVIADARDGDAAVATRGIAVPLKARSGEHYVAHLMPLTSGARLATGRSYSAAAAVFIRKATLDLPLPIEAVARQSNLTPAEIRVLYAVLEVGGVAAMAAMLGLSEPTVRTHLHHLFEKTGTGSQIELVKLVAGLASPLLQ
jgi:DNA-binding CsgD family transcriptional regulator